MSQFMQKLRNLFRDFLTLFVDIIRSYLKNASAAR